MISPITLDALRVLEAIERKKSFAGAADELFRVPSAISYTISKLEDDLAITLFDRSKRKAELTPVGQMIVEQGRLILNATNELTHMAKKSANGWELELRICIDSLLPFKPLYSLIALFQQEFPWIDIRLTEEVFGGTWDALMSGRCDLMIGAEGDSSGNEFTAHGMGSIEFIFAVSANHPLCNTQKPITDAMIKKYPSIVVADSSRHLPARSAGLLDGQARITVPTMEKKIEAHCQGIGVGWLPIHRITSELATNKLVALPLKDHANRHHDLYIAWGKNNKGKALAWFVEQLKKMDTSELYRVD